MTNRRELADRLEGGASGAFHPQMVADLREAARLLREPVAGEADRLVIASIISGLQRNRIAEYPGGPKVHEGLGWENLDEIVDRVFAILRARLDDEGKG